MARTESKRRTLLVGAGITNLITALNLVERGHHVVVLEAGRNPFAHGGAVTDANGIGATLSGGDARMFTLTEQDNYNESGSAIYADMTALFRRSATEGGWSVKAGPMSAAESRWMQRHETLPPHAAREYRDEIYLFTHEARKGWERLRQSHADLFWNVNFTPDVLRLYTEPEALKAAAALQRDVGALRRELTASEAAAAYPALAGPCRSGELAGGLEVVGFTLNIHPFCRKLIARLKSLGVEFHWGVQAEALRKNASGCVTGVQASDGVYTADNYIVSPGAYGNALLRGTGAASDGYIQGVLGVWVTIPNTDPQLTHSLKIHRAGHVTEDANVTIATGANGEPVLHLGTGYGYTGEHPSDIDPKQLERLYAGARDYARMLFPQATANLSDADLAATHRYCVRPWTPTGLGVFEVLPAADGGKLIIVGGHNTGGFTQSPAVADAVVETVAGRHSAMADLYDPRRGWAGRTDVPVRN